MVLAGTLSRWRCSLAADVAHPHPTGEVGCCVCIGGAFRFLPLKLPSVEKHFFVASSLVALSAEKRTLVRRTYVSWFRCLERLSLAPSAMGRSWRSECLAGGSSCS
jgi:hypothetical protein